MTKSTQTSDRQIQLEVDGQQVEVPDDGASLLEVLRDRLGSRSPKDGCSPQGQCGCCTVLVDGSPRVACVTPAKRVAGRAITTLDGLPDADRERWAEAFTATGASQCGFCTPGIVLRLVGLERKGVEAGDDGAVAQALLAHLCRCTGWRSIFEAFDVAVGGGEAALALPDRRGSSGVGEGARDFAAAARRAELEGHAPQQVGPHVALGGGGFADDTAPADALVAVPDGQGNWAVGETLVEARRLAGKVQGRRTTIELEHPIGVPPGDWDLTLQTGWVDPGYLETDASWCEPGGQPATPLANGGAFGGKTTADAAGTSGMAVADVARTLADRHGRAVRVLLSREDVVRMGPKRPPLAAGVRIDGTGVVRVARAEGVGEAIRSVAPGLEVEEVDVVGPPVSAAIRGAGWVEAAVLLAAVSRQAGSSSSTAGSPTEITAPNGATARALVGDGGIEVRVACGEVLDETVLRSFCLGAAHMAYSWVTSEGIAVDETGAIHDLTIRSLGVVRAVDMPRVTVVVESGDGPPVNGSDAVFAAVAAATWVAKGCPPSWPTDRR